MRKLLIPAAAAVAAVISLQPVGAAQDADALMAEKIPLADTQMFIEINDTDGDAGLQVVVDGEDWRNLTVFGPDGKKVLAINTRGSLRSWGMTGMNFESAEPPFDEVPLSTFLDQFPAGRYRFIGRTTDGDRLVGRATLTHKLPAGPEVTQPLEDATVPANDVVIRWEPSTDTGMKVVRYQVIVTAEDTDREYLADLPASATRLPVPREFLDGETDYKVEVIVKERSGNQTITEVPFTVS